MAITIYSEDQILLGILNNFRLQFPDKDLSDRSYLGLVARAIAQSLSMVQAAVQRVDWDSPPAYQQDADGTIRTKTSSEALDQWAFVFGIPSDVPGIYGRRGPVAAAGGVGDPTGVANTVFPALSVATDSTGQVLVQLNAAFTVGVSPANSSSYTCLTKGIAGNLPAGSVLTWQSPPAGGNSTVTLSVGLGGGKDKETDADLLRRLLYRIQHPPRGGVASDYRYWAENSTNSSGVTLNIGRAYVYPKRNGLGTVDVMPLLNASGRSRDPGATIATAVKTYLDTVRPVTAIVEIMRPFFRGQGMSVIVRITPSQPRYNFDFLWDNNANVKNARAITALPAINKIQFLGVDINLQSAVDNGLKPRIQITNTPSGRALPDIRTITAYDTVTVPGSTILTLNSSLSPQPNVNTDFFYPASSAVLPIAQSVINYIDSLGPSRASGTADPLDSWDSTLSISKIADTVLETRDTDGTKFCKNIPNINTDGVLVALTRPNYTNNDYTAVDLGIAFCELIVPAAGGMLVTIG